MKIWCVCVCIYVMEYYSDIKKKEFPICRNMDGQENITLSEINQTERDKYCMISLICRIYKTQQTTANTVHIIKKRQTYRYREQTSGQCRGEGMDKLLDIIIKIIKDVFYHPENIANIL